MKIAFVTTQTLTGSTNVGRILPLAAELSNRDEVHVIAHQGSTASTPKGIHAHYAGKDPFTRTEHGKKRLHGIMLIGRMKLNIIAITLILVRLKPDAIVISKSLPESVAATWLATRLLRKTKVILDVDDFELTSNELTSLTQRAAVHAAERLAIRIADVVVAATPFLQDHFAQLTKSKQDIVLLPTGIPSKIHDISNPDTKHLLYLGSVTKRSGHRVDLLPDILQHVHASHPGTTLTIAGTGDEVEELKQVFNKLGLADAVRWHGRFTADEVEGLLKEAGILIDPIDASVTNRAKSSSRVALAAASGVPIITANVGIRPHFLPTSLQQKCFAEPGDPASYAEKIVNWLNTPITKQERERMKQQSKQYSWRNLGQTYQRHL